MENDYSLFIIPRTLDEPEKILFFTYLELAIFIFPLIVGITFEYTISGLLFGIFFLILYKKSKHKYSVTHLSYWFLPEWLFNLQALPPSSYRIFLG